MKGWVFAIVVACTGVQAGCQSAPMLPAELADHSWMFEGLREPPLFGANASDGLFQRIRIVVIPHYLGRPKVVVRLDQTKSGDVRGVSIYGEDTRGHWVTTDRRHIDVSIGQMERLGELIREAGIWNTYQFERREGSCTDGTLVMLERASVSGYQFSLANAPCGTPRAYLDVVDYIARLADRDIKGWLRY